MPFKPGREPASPDYKRLLGTLHHSDVKTKDNALYQVVKSLIDWGNQSTRNTEAVIATAKTGGSGEPGEGTGGGGTGSGSLPKHATKHQEGGSDEVDVTQLSGYTGNTTEFLRADGQFAPVLSGAAATQVVREIPAGAINGVNHDFTLANTPVVGSEQVYLNGLLQDERGIDYSIVGAVITFILAPISGDRILVTYQRL